MHKIESPNRRHAIRAALAGLAAFGLSVASGPALAQAYPAKPIRWVVPYPPGGGADIVARLIAGKLSQSLGQQVVVDNKPGASTIIGTDMVAKAPADGYTIGLITDSHAINPIFFPKLPYDTLKDFEAVSQLVFVPLVLVANPTLNVKSVAELVAAAKSRPGKINYASIGNGTPHQLAMEWLKALSGAQMTHIPYKGVAPALTDVMGGQVDVMFTGTSTAAPQVREGKLVALAVSSARRQPAMPSVPSVAESPGLADFDFMTWYGVAAPAGTPRDVVQRLSRELASALNQPDVKDRLAQLGLVGAPSSSEEFKVFIERESKSLARLVKTTGVKPE